MKILINVFFLFIISATAQNTKNVESKEVLVKSFKVSENYIFCSNTNGIIYVWNLNTMEKVDSLKLDNTFFNCITKDKNGHIYLGTKNSKIYKINNNKLELILDLSSKIKDREIYHIYFNSKNELFVIHNRGIYSPSKNKTWSEFDQRGTIVSLKKRVFIGKKRKPWGYKYLKDFFTLPDYIYKDKSGVLWMSKSYGEWGSSSHRFSIEKEIIIKNDEDNYISPDYLFEDNSGLLYGTNGSMHFFQYGSIEIIENNKIKKNINSKEIRGTDGNVIFKDGLMLGPATYNEFNGKYYFSTTNGIYEAEFSNNEFVNFKQFWQPKLNWKQEPLAIGVAMSYKELKFVDETKLLVLTSNNGLALYDGKSMKWLN